MHELAGGSRLGQEPKTRLLIRSPIIVRGWRLKYPDGDLSLHADVRAQIDRGIWPRPEERLDSVAPCEQLAFGAHKGPPL